MIILLDMDGVLANFEQGLLQAFQTHYPSRPCIPLGDRRGFYAHEQYPKEDRKRITQLITAKGFFRNLPPIQGAIEACQALFASQHEIFFCTSPISRYQHCVLEKYQWIEAHLGFDYTKRMILTKDKTVIHGDILIDDRPQIHGVHSPSWEHVLYAQPYNKDVHDKRRLTWENWQELIPV